MAQSIVQASHASLDLGLSIAEKPSQVAHLVLIGAEDERHLLDIKDQVDNHGICNTIFFEPDDDLGYTALATVPVYGKQRALFKNFKLWKAPDVPTHPKG